MSRKNFISTLLGLLITMAYAQVASAHSHPHLAEPVVVINETALSEKHAVAGLSADTIHNKASKESHVQNHSIKPFKSTKLKKATSTLAVVNAGKFFCDYCSFEFNRKFVRVAVVQSAPNDYAVIHKHLAFDHFLNFGGLQTGETPI